MKETLETIIALAGAVTIFTVLISGAALLILRFPAISICVVLGVGIVFCGVAFLWPYAKRKVRK